MSGEEEILGLNFFWKNDIIILNKKTCLGYVVKMRKRGSVLIEWDLFFVIILIVKDRNLDNYIKQTGGGLNDELGFDCFDSYNHIVFDF